jgi:hypothetical protein
VVLQKSVEPLVSLRAANSVDADFFYLVTEQAMRPHVIAAGGSWEKERRRTESAEDAICPGTSGPSNPYSAVAVLPFASDTPTNAHVQ